MSFSKLATVAVVGVALAVSAGCGSSKSSTSTTTTVAATVAKPLVTTTPAKLARSGSPLTHTTLIAKGDAICTDIKRKLGAMSARTTPEFLRTLPQAAIYYNTESERLGRLVPPAALAGDWSQIVSDMHYYSEYADRIEQYANEGQEKTAGKVLEQGIALQEKWIAIAKRDGFKNCSRLR